MLIGNKSLKERILELEKIEQECKKQLNEYKNEIQKLSDINKNQDAEIEALRKTVLEYKQKYEETGLECIYCYGTLQKNFKACPNCGKRIEQDLIELKTTDESIFGIENAGQDCIITSYIGFEDKEIIIPSTINGRRVIGIWNEAFRNCTNLESVIFDEGCTYIGEYAFAGCSNLKQIRFPKTLKEIGKCAFFVNTSLSEIIIPKNVTAIGECAFECRKRLKHVVLPEKLEYISYKMLSNTAIEEIKLPEKLKLIQSCAFERTPLKELEIPEEVEKIELFAFDECRNMKKFIVRTNVVFDETSIGLEARSCNPVVYCSAGSTGQEYARMHRLQYKRIEPVIPEMPTNESGYRRMIIPGASRVTIDEVRSILGVTKMETYSWKKDFNQIVIDKYFTYDEGKVFMGKGWDIGIPIRGNRAYPELEKF